MEELIKTFPTISAGLKEMLELSWSLNQSAGYISEYSDENYWTYENETYNQEVVSAFLNNCTESLFTLGDSIECEFKYTAFKVYFEYRTTGKLGFSFSRLGDNDVTFKIWKLFPSEEQTLTKDFEKAGWISIQHRNLYDPGDGEIVDINTLEF